MAAHIRKPAARPRPGGSANPAVTILVADRLNRIDASAKGWKLVVALTPQRHAVVDAELQYIHQYFISLASEINTAAPLTDKRGLAYHAAVNVAVQVAHLRHLLADNEKIPHTEQEHHRRLSGGRLRSNTA